MHDPKYEVEVEVGGEHYTLAFTIGARRRIEAHFEKSLKQVVEAVDPDDIEVNVVFFWACMKRHHADVALAELYDRVDDLPHSARIAMLEATGKAIALDTDAQEEPGEVRPPNAGKSGTAKKPSATS